MRCPVVVDLPESTWPMTTLLIWVFSLPVAAGPFLQSLLEGSTGVGEATAFQACLSPLLPSTLLLSSIPSPLHSLAQSLGHSNIN